MLLIIDYMHVALYRYVMYKGPRLSAYAELWTYVVCGCSMRALKSEYYISWLYINAQVGFGRSKTAGVSSLARLFTPLLNCMLSPNGDDQKLVSPNGNTNFN